MKEADRLARNEQMLKELHPWMRRPVFNTIDELEETAWPNGRGKYRPRIQCAWRSPAQQLREVAEGDSQTPYGFHNVTGPNDRPESFAVDLLDDDDPLDLIPTNRGSHYFLALAAVAAKHGLTTGIRWSLPEVDRFRIDTAIAAGDFNRAVRIGKDPTHLQPAPGTGVLIEKLRMGWRPAVETMAPAVARLSAAQPHPTALAAPSEPVVTLKDALAVPPFPETSDTVNWEGSHIYTTVGGQMRQFGYRFGQPPPATPGPRSFLELMRAQYPASLADGLRQWVVSYAAENGEPNPAKARAWWIRKGLGEPEREVASRINWMIFEALGGK